jgi:hypothetical protein
MGREIESRQCCNFFKRNKFLELKM